MMKGPGSHCTRLSWRRFFHGCCVIRQCLAAGLGLCHILGASVTTTAAFGIGCCIAYSFICLLGVAIRVSEPCITSQDVPAGSNPVLHSTHRDLALHH